MTSTANDLTERLGAVLLEPDLPIIAGRHGSWTITLTVGSYGIDEGGTIKIARRLANDWEAPQFDRPGESGYCTVTTNGDAVLKPRYERKGHIRPWLKCLVIDVIDGSLAPGDKVRVVMGDRSQGSPGMRAQSFVESRHEIRVLVDPTNACLVRPLPTSPVMRIIADEPVRMIAVVPSLVEVGRTFQIYCRGEDRWGNPTPLKTAPGIDWTGTGAVSRAADGWTAISPGLGQFRLACGDLEGTSNSVEFVKTLPALRPFWGDLHAQTDSTVGTGTEEEYFRFGREQARLDFIGHQGNDFQITSEDWTRLNEAINRHNEDHAYVTLPGYEWSGNTPAGGDRNVFFLQENPPIFRSSHWQVPGETEDSLSPAHPADQLFERVKAHGNAFTCAHVGGRYADITRYFDQDVCPLVEVASCWGIFEWILRDALERDYVVGVMANSDGHKGRPGAEGPGAGEFGIGGGLTCVLAPELTRRAIFDALINRRCYGTTGPRIAIDIDIMGHPMGWKGRVTEGAVMRARVMGDAPIEKLQVFRDLDCMQTVWNPAFGAIADSRKFRILWKGARHRGPGQENHVDGQPYCERDGYCVSQDGCL